MLQGYFIFILNKHKFNTYKSEISIVKWRKRKEKKYPLHSYFFRLTDLFLEKTIRIKKINVLLPQLSFA